jgi:succinate dehydrogenase/fumarate reductase cytochrome b subunit
LETCSTWSSDYEHSVSFFWKLWHVASKFVSHIAISMVVCNDSFRWSHEFIRNYVNWWAFSTHIYKHKKNYEMRPFLLQMLLSCATVLTFSYVDLSPTLFFLILTVGSSCFIAYWNQHQSTSDCTCGQYRIWSSCHCYRVHIYIGFCKLLLDHLISFIFPSMCTSFCKFPQPKT